MPPKDRRNEKLDVNFLLNDASSSSALPAVSRSGSRPAGRAQAPNERARCTICGHSFTQVGDLKKHIRTVHEKQRPFKCDICGKAFGEKGKDRHSLLSTNSLTDLFPRQLAETSPLGSFQCAPVQM